MFGLVVHLVCLPDLMVKFSLLFVGLLLGCLITVLVFCVLIALV